MSLEDSYGDAHQRMKDIRSQVQRKIDAIRDDTRLSAAGRREAMANVTSKARQQADQLRDQHMQLRKARRDSLQRSLFGLPEGASVTEVAVWRDATSRAADIGEEKLAVEALERSRRLGDQTMVRAILERSLAKGWADAIDAFTNAPDGGEMTANVLMLRSLDAIPSGPRTDLSDMLVFSVPTPHEIASYNNGFLGAEQKPPAANALQLLGSSTSVGRPGSGAATPTTVPPSTQQQVAEILSGADRDIPAGDWWAD